MSDHIALEWIGRPYEAVRVSREERKSPEYLAINPAGAVPAFEQDGWVLTQNAAILNYLADSFPDARLAATARRAAVPRSTGGWPWPTPTSIRRSIRCSARRAYLEDPALIELSKQAARAKLRRLFERVDAQLAGRDWIAGIRSIADPYLFVVTRWAKAMEVDLSGLDNLHALLRAHACRSRRAARAATGRPGLRRSE